MLINCVRVPLYLLVVFVLDSGIEYYDAFDDNSTLEPILTNTYNGGIVLVFGGLPISDYYKADIILFCHPLEIHPR